MKFATAALFLLAMTMASAAPNKVPVTQATEANMPVSAKSLALARQLVTDTGIFENIAHMSVQMMMGIVGPKIITSPQLYLKAYQRALDDHRDDISRENAVIAEGYARMLTPQELSDEIAFWESPIGRSIRRKQEAAETTIFSGHYTPPVFTIEEKSAQAAFAAKGENSKAKKIALLIQMRVAMAPLLRSISDEAMKNYCKSVGDCPETPVPAPKPPAK